MTPVARALWFFEYLCGFAIADGRDLAPDFRAVRIPARRHLVFRHEGHVSAIGATWNAVMNVWLPASAYRMAHAPSFERCPPSFDPHTGMGGIDICVPVEG